MFVLLCYIIIIYKIIIGEAGSSTVSRTILYIFYIRITMLHYKKVSQETWTSSEAHHYITCIFDLYIRVTYVCKIIIGEAGSGTASRNLALDATAAIGNLELHLLYIRLIERMRRCIAHEYGLALLHLSPRQSFINRLHSSLNPAGRERILLDCLFGLLF